MSGDQKEAMNRVGYLLSQTLKSTSEEVRSAAETQLKFYAKQDGFLLILLCIVGQQGSPGDTSLQQSAAIYFKNTMMKRWPPGYNEEKEAAALNEEDGTLKYLSIQDQQLLRDQILPVYFQANASIRVMIDEQYETKWPSILKTLLDIFSSYQPQAATSHGLSLESVSAGLDVFLVLVKAKNSEKRMEGILFQQGFPFLLSLIKHVLFSTDSSTSRTEESFWIAKKVLKIWMSSVVYVLPKNFQDRAFMDPWMSVLLRVIEMPTPTLMVQKVHQCLIEENSDSLSELTRDGYWKMKKWALHSINRLFQRYGTTTSKNSGGSQGYPEFCKLFTVVYAERCVQVYMGLVAGLCQSQSHAVGYIPDRLVCLLCDFMDRALSVKSLWLALVKPHVKALIENFIFPRLCITKEDLDIWLDDPLLYIQSRLDPFEDFTSVRTSCTSVLLSLVKKRKKTTMTILLPFLENNLNAGNSLAKDGVIYILGFLSEDFQPSGKDSTQTGALEPATFEALLNRHIVPELTRASSTCGSSTPDFLKVRACWLLQNFDASLFTEQLQVSLFQGLTTCMTQGSSDMDLPVRVQAAISIGAFLGLESLRGIIVQNIGPLMECLLALSQKTTDMDTLSFVMEKVVNLYPEQIVGFAVALTFQLKESLMKILRDPLLSTVVSAVEGEEGVPEERDFEAATDKLMAACGIFKTISTLVMTIDSGVGSSVAIESGAMNSTASMIGQMEDILLEPILHVLHSGQTDVYDEIFELIDGLTFMRKFISPGMWQVTLIILENFLRIPSQQEYFTEMMAALENVISYGTQELLMSNSSGGILHLLIAVIQKAYKSEQLGENEQAAACQLMTSLILYAWELMNKTSDPTSIRKVLLQIIPTFVEIVAAPNTNAKQGTVGVLFKFTGKSAIVYHCSVILAAILFDPTFTLNLLKDKNALFAFLKFFQENHTAFVRVHDKRLLILVCNSLLALVSSDPNNFAFPEVSNFVVSLFAILKFAFESLPKAIQNRKELEDRVGENESDDDDYGFSEDEGDLEDDDNEEDTLNHAQAYRVAISNEPKDLVSENNYNEEDDDTDSAISWIDDELEEEPFLETPMDNLDLYSITQSTLSSLSPNILQLYRNATSDKDQQAFLDALTPPPRTAASP